MTGGGDAHTTTPAEAAAAAISPTVSIATLCEARAVDAQLLHNSSELAASNLLRRSSRYVTAGRVLSLMALASAAAAGLLASWQHRRIYRVWRLRHPRRVAQQRRLMWGSAASSVALLLLLVSPVGCMALHEARHNDARRLDDIAVRALVLKQRYEAAATSGRKEAGDVYDRCEKDWAALMKERVAIDENV